MRIDLRNPQRQLLFTVEVDPGNPPTVVRPPSADIAGTDPASGSSEATSHATHPASAAGPGLAVHLNWDRAIDDEQHLRHCPACGCEDLYVRHEMPRLTAFVMVALAGVIAVVMLGLGWLTYALIVLGVVGLIDAGVYLFFSGKVLICYRCRSEYRGMPIGADSQAWESSLDDRYRRASGKSSSAKNAGGSAA